MVTTRQQSGNLPSPSKLGEEPPAKKVRRSADLAFFRPKSHRKGGDLSKIHDIPNEVLCEIASHLYPLDILHLARTTRAWRSELLSKESAPVWRAARSSIPQLPDCPADMTEAGYAKLMFEHDCYECPTYNTLNAALFALRVRCCARCTSKHIFSADEFEDLFPELDSSVLQIVPYSTEINGSERLYYTKSVQKVVEALVEKRDTCNPEQCEQWISEQATYVSGLATQEAELNQCHWLWRDAEQEIRNAVVIDRLNAIKARFRALGYDEHDLHWSSPGNEVVFKRQVLTDRIWVNIRSQVEAHVIQNRDERLAVQRDKAIRLRRRRLRSLYKVVYPSPTWTAPGTFCPTFADFFNFPSIQPLMQQPLTDPQLDWPEMQILEDETQELHCRITRDILAALKTECSGESESHFDDASVLQNPMSVVACSHCDTPLHWPALLYHEHIRFFDPNDDVPALEGAGETRPWDPQLIWASALTAAVMEAMLKSTVSDPETTGFDNLKKRRKFGCGSCFWTGMTYQEFFQHYVRESRENHQKHDPKNVVLRTYRSAIPWPEDNKEYCCRLCGPRRFLYEGALSHLKDRHHIVSPQAETYIERNI